MFTAAANITIEATMKHLQALRGRIGTGALAGALALWLPLLAHAHGDQAHAAQKPRFDASKVEDTPFGRQGDPAKVTRTLQIDMSDSMRFSPASLQVKPGDTVRLVARNRGKLLHVMVLGHAQALQEHAELMKKFPDMEHDEPHMVHVKPGSQGEIIWQFTQAGTFQFACLLPGHFDAGMVGSVTVKGP